MDIGTFIWKIKKFGFENILRRYYSIYPAIVVDNVDPENRGRVKLKVPDILDDIELAEWAEPELTNGGSKYGVFYPSKIDDYVWVKFRMGDIRNPVYHGGWWASDEKPSELSDQYKNAIFISRDGHKIIVDETPTMSNITLETSKGFKIVLDDSAGGEKILIFDKNGAKLEFNSLTNKVTLLSEGTTLIESSSSAAIKQPQIAIGNGSVELLKAIHDMMTALGSVQILTPVGPAAPMTASAQWIQVQQQMVKIQSITGSF